MIRLLNELVEKNPSLAYAEACIDTRLGESKATHYTYYSISDIETREAVWKPSESESENWRTVVVLGNY